MSPVFIIVHAVILCVLTSCSPTFEPPLLSVSSSPSISDHTFTAYDNTQLPMRAWLPSSEIDGVLIGVHGFNDYSNFIKDSVNFFNDHKIAVYAYDQRGFGGARSRGRWSGRQTLSHDLTTFIMLVKQKHPDLPIYVLGDSMGGAVTIVTMAQENPPEIDGAILVAPAVWARSEMPFYQRWLLWIAAHTLPWQKVTGESLDIQPSDNIEMLKELGKDPMVIKETRIDVLYGLSILMDVAYWSAELFRTKSLLLYGQNDEIIPKRPVMNFYNRLPRKDQNQQQMILYENGYHMLLRDLQADVVHKDIIDWLENRGHNTNK